MRSSWPSARSLVALLGAVLFLASCSSSAKTRGGVEPSPEPTTSTISTTCPYTGREPATGVNIRRPAIAVKIENSPQARPQSGLDRADVVFEELVEGGITRFAAIFQCDSVKKAGPVRSARFDDPAFIKPFTRGLAFAGANATVTKSLKKHRMKLFTDLTDAKALYRVPPGNTNEHSLFANVTLLLKQAASKHIPGPTADMFRFAPLTTQPTSVRKVDLMFEKTSVAEPITWKWRRGSWRRYEGGTPFLAANGKQISAPNLLIQKVKAELSRTLVDVAGNPSPRFAFSGKGKVLLFRDGGVINGRWRRARNGSFKYLDSTGARLSFAPGPVWIELLPSKKGEIKGTVKF